MSNFLKNPKTVLKPRTGRSTKRGEILFTLDIKTAEITFKTDALALGRKKDLNSELVAS